jgi:predicted RNase H-like HicB family nuclease
MNATCRDWRGGAHVPHASWDNDVVVKIRDIVKQLEDDARRTDAMKYLIVIEHTATGYSAYSPDLPGCIATGSTREEVEREMKGAIAFHLDGLKAEGMVIPQPSSFSSYVEIPA